MIYIKTPQEIEQIAHSCKILRQTFAIVGANIKPGMTTAELDSIAYNAIVKEKDCKPAFLHYQGFPGTACISVNNEVIHGIPGNRIIQNGDLVSVDMGVNYKGYISDSAHTFPVGKITAEEEKLIADTKAALAAGIKAAIPGNRISDISKAIYEVIKNYGVVYDYCGHGVGLELHEDPQIPNVVTKHGKNPRIKSGMVVAIEPMVNLGTADVEVLDDNWTVATADGKKSAHFEHTIAITNDGTFILT